MESLIMERKSYGAGIKIWLFAGVFMLFVQIIIGGVTRLTGSGLSITKWEIITGSIPPLNAAQWNEAFDLYKETPQYHKINKGMSLQEFKFIYFWEYFHRVWARTMGFVFIIPFFYFLYKRKIDHELMTRLGIVVLLAMLAASFGWIMVASGLVNRPWVNAYKLTLHLGIALSVYGYLLWTALHVWYPEKTVIHSRSLKNRMNWVFGLLAAQLLLGGLMSGMKAGILFPTWPDMNGTFIPDVILSGREWTLDSFKTYDATPFMPALIQFLHRGVAYVLTFMILWFLWSVLRMQSNASLKRGAVIMAGALALQVLLGILTVINCRGLVPVSLGVFHQAGAVLLFTAVLNVLYQLKTE